MHCLEGGATAAGKGLAVTLAMAAGPPPPLEPSPLPTFPEEGFADKFLRKTRENPLVPLGEGGAGGGGTEPE